MRVTGPWRRSTSLARELLVLQVALLVVVMLAVAVVDAVLDVRRDEQAAAQRVLGVAESLALSPTVQELAVAPGTVQSRSAVLQPFVEAVRSETRLSFITVMAPDGTRWTHPDAAQIGRTFLGSREPALSGQPFTETYAGTLGPSVRAVVPVFASAEATEANGTTGATGPTDQDDDGARRVVGLVAVGVTTAQLNQEFLRSLPLPLALLAAMLGVSLAGSALVSRRLRRQTHGMASDDIERLRSSHEAVLHSVREGLLVVDPDGRVGVANDEARRLLGLESDPVGVPVAELPIATSVRDVLVEGRAATDETHLTDDRVLVVSQSQVEWTGRRHGAVVTLRDRTELEALTGELDSTRALSEALRSQAHEAANRLHTVVVLVETGHPDRAVEYAVEQLELSQRLTDSVLESVEEPVVSALLLGKTAQAAERAVTVRIHEDSHLPADLVTAPGSSRDLVTVLGNLLDNAVDASAAPELGGGPRDVNVLLRPDGDDLLVRVDDTGPGLPPELVATAFTRGWSTKVATSVAGRGLGLSLVDQVVRRRGGTVEVLARSDVEGIEGIQDDDGGVSGTRFEVRLPLAGLR
ncbi:sensor histidine kinase [Quadrisphaera granulorum]|uniref:sensor histidine kinase n=1 Tax=Quadrisphaera granulorum TaxID=317664 RepID=UPI001B869B4E|nr:sensor histidine kinase [Quadrisphaera granulorum]